MKYGLNLRAPPTKQKKQLTRPTALGFGVDDDTDVGNDISRQATTNKARKDVSDSWKHNFFSLFLIL